jgi:hypothetical protein
MQVEGGHSTSGSDEDWAGAGQRKRDMCVVASERET